MVLCLITLTDLYMRHAGLSASAELLVYLRDVVSAVYTTQRGWLAGWLAGWVSVTCPYCIKMAKPILKRICPSGSPVILVSSDPCTDAPFQNPRGTPSVGALITLGGKNGDFRRKSPFISETIRDKPMTTTKC